MNQWLIKWQSLTQQEQRILLLLGGLLVALVGYKGIYAPLQQAVAAAELRVNAQHKTRMWAMATGEKILALRAKHPSVKDNAGSVQAIVNRTSGQYQVSISRLQAQDNELTLTLDNVNFDQCLLWLADLYTGYGIKVRLLDVQALPIKGQVMVRRLIVGRE